MKQLICTQLSIESPVISQSTSHVYGNNIYIVAIDKIHIFNTETQLFTGSITLSDTTMKKSSYLHNNIIYIVYCNPTTASLVNRKKWHVDIYNITTSAYTHDYFTMTNDYYNLDVNSQMLYSYTNESNVHSIRGFLSCASSSSSTTQNNSARAYFNTNSASGTNFNVAIIYSNSIVKKGQPVLYNGIYYLANSHSSGKYLYSISNSGKQANMQQVVALPSAMINTALVKSFIYNNEIYFVDSDHFYKYNVSGQSFTIVNATLPISLGECWANIVGDRVYFFDPSGAVIKCEFTEFNNTYMIYDSKGTTQRITTSGDLSPLTSVRFDYDKETNTVTYQFQTMNDLVSGTYTYTPSVSNAYLKGFKYIIDGADIDITLNTTVNIYETTSITFYEIEGLYENQYILKNTDGTHTYITSEATYSKISTLQFKTLENDRIQFLITTVTGQSISRIYLPTVPSGFTLIGYSLNPSASTVMYEFNTEYTDFNDESITFYEVYEMAIPSTGGFGTVLYRNNAEKNKVDKSLNLVLVASVSGRLRDEITDIVNPVIQIEYPRTPNFNYVYIETFGRYYYVTDIKIVRTNLYEISLKCDVLMSYKEIIKQQTAFIERQENLYNTEIGDDIMPAQNGKEIHTVSANNNIFFPSKVANENTNSFFRYLYAVVGIHTVK